MKSVDEVLKEHEQYSLWRMMRNESFSWSMWLQHQPVRASVSNINCLILMPSISKIGSRRSISARAAGFNLYKHYESTDKLVDWMLSDMKWKIFPNAPAFPYSVENPIINRPDCKYEIFWLMNRYYASGGNSKLNLWNLNPITKDITFTDTTPLLVSLGLR